MGRRIGGLLAVRLLVVICAVALPIYFVFLFAVFPYKIYPYPFQIYPILINNPIYQFVMQLLQLILPFSSLDCLVNYVVAPFFFSLPWLLFIVINRTRVANTFAAMGSSTTVIPLRYRMFYGFAALIVILFFILPTVSPILSIIAGIILAGRIVTMSDWAWKAGTTTIRKIYGALLVFMICPLPVYVAYIFYSRQIFILLANWIWSVWTNVMVMVYSIAMCIVDSLAIGSIIWLIFAGAGEFEVQTYGSKITEVPYKLLAIFQIIVFLVLAYFTVPYIYFPGISSSGYITWGGRPELLFNIINYICLGIFVVVTLIMLVRGASKRAGFNPSLVGFVLAGAFIGVDYFTGKYITQLALIPSYISLYLRTVPNLVLSCIPSQYWSNLYIPINEIPKIFTYFSIYTGNPIFLNIAYQIWYLIQTSILTTLIAMFVASLLWFVAFIWSFKKASSKEPTI